MLNQAQLIGFTGAEAEIRTLQGGKKVATLRVCTSRYSKKGGERKDYPTWHTIEVWNQASVNWLETKGLAKGAKVFVQGEIRNEQFTGDDNQTRYYSKIVVATAAHDLRSLERPVAGDAEDA